MKKLLKKIGLFAVAVVAGANVYVMNSDARKSANDINIENVAEARFMNTFLEWGMGNSYYANSYIYGRSTETIEVKCTHTSGSWTVGYGNVTYTTGTTSYENPDPVEITVCGSSSGHCFADEDC